MFDSGLLVSTIYDYSLLCTTMYYYSIHYYLSVLFCVAIHPKIPGASSPNIVGRDLFTKLSMLLHPKMMDRYEIPEMPPA